MIIWDLIDPPFDAHVCNMDALVFQGHVAAPGYGTSFRCPVCERYFLKLGTSWVEPGEGICELDPEDVR